MSVVQRVMDNGSETIRGLKNLSRRATKRETMAGDQTFLVGNIYFAKARALYMDISSSPVLLKL